LPGVKQKNDKRSALGIFKIDNQTLDTTNEAWITQVSKFSLIF
jgi:hypothetical protein